MKVVGIIILKRKRGKDNRGNDILSFELLKDFKFENFGLSNVCQYMYFDSNDSDKIIIIANQICMKLNIITAKRENIYELEGWEQHPDLLVFNNDQTVFIISSNSDSMMIDIVAKTQVDIDD